MLSRPGEQLAHWTTLRLGGPAASFVDANSSDELNEAVAAADSRDEPFWYSAGAATSSSPTRASTG